MDVNVICISLCGNLEQTAWGALIIDEEFMTEMVGISDDNFSAALQALSQSLESLPTALPIMIRCTDRITNDIGKKFVPIWKKEGYSDEPLAAEIEYLLSLLEKRTCIWSKITMCNELDKQGQQLAKDQFASLQDTSSIAQEKSEEVSFVEQLEEASIDETLAVETKKSVAQINIETSCPEKIPQELLIPLIPLSPSSTEITKASIESTPISSIPQQKTASQARILIYVDAIISGNLACWSFVLVDREHHFALLQAAGLRSSSLKTAQIIGCSSAIKKLQDHSLPIEIRSRYPELIDIGEHKLSVWAAQNWQQENGEEPPALPFLQELHSLLKSCTVSWKYISQETQEKGIIDCHNIAQEALHRLNYGERSLLETRQADYPIEQLSK